MIPRLTEYHDHERRIRRLEFWAAFFAGAVAIGTSSSVLTALKLFRVIP